MHHKEVFQLLIRLPIAMGMILLNLVLMLVGFLLVAVAPYSDEQWRWRWMQSIYGNNEDGIDGLLVPGKNVNWTAATAKWSAFRRRWVWSAWRNSVNNIRYTKLLATPALFPVPDSDSFAFMIDGPKFWLQVPLGHSAPWWILWLGWHPTGDGIPSAFKATITSLAKPGA